jgi:hypothetical protein
VFLGRKNESVTLTELQVTEISIQMIQLGQNFQFNSPQLVSGFVTSSGKSYPIEIQSFIEVIDEKKWFEHLGCIDQTPTSFLEIIVHQILRFQELTGGISGKIASQLGQILTEKKSDRLSCFPSGYLTGFHGKFKQKSPVRSQRMV